MLWTDQFPTLAEGADANCWAQEFGYPLESQTGNISFGGLMDEVRASDEAGRFMLVVYNQFVAQNGGILRLMQEISFLLR